VIFNPVGASSIGSNLIDLEFLPGQNGEAIVISQDGNVYYLKSDFTPLAQSVSINVNNGNEQGLLNVQADPGYADAANHFVYFYYTVPGPTNPAVNRVERRKVVVNTNTGDFALNDPETIIEFDKSQNTQSGENHNGGSMVFDLQGNLYIGVGDGGGSGSTNQTAQIGQDPALTLGKIHRIIPNRQDGSGGFTVPSGQPFTVNFKGSPVQAVNSIFSLGVRNPFSSVVDEDGDLFFADVGNNTFEELDCAYVVDAPENYGWPFCEGPCTTSHPEFRDPTHGYRHGDSTFDDEDPAVDPTGNGEAIMINAFYQGTQYNGLFTDKYIYSEFFHGWVRLLELNQFDIKVSDQNIGHLEGLISLHENPADGMLYGVSLFGTDSVQRDHVLRMDLAQ
jgi:glucose/arabinose dehydrogenase